MSSDQRFLEDLVGAVLARGADLHGAASLLQACGTAAQPTVRAEWLRVMGFDLNCDGAATRSLAALEDLGLLRPRPTGWTIDPAARLADLAASLRGAAAAWKIARDTFTPHVAVTLPGPNSAIARALREAMIDHGRLVSTEEAMEALAAKAVNELVVATPFLNDAAAPALSHLFRLARAPKRVLIVRNSHKVRRALATVGRELSDTGVQVVNYRRGVGATTYETFHAKIVLADTDHAYVGSANFLRYAHTSVEMGVILSGDAVRIVGGIVRAIRAVSEPCEIPIAEVA